MSNQAQAPAVLVADDDPHIAELVSLYLKKEGFRTIEAATGKQAVEMFAKFSPGLVMLDIMLPQMDGYEVCRQIRRISRVPVIMMSARGETFDKVLGLEMGADDYVVKPFDLKELAARVKAVLRRYEKADAEEPGVIVFPGLTIDQGARAVVYHGKNLDLPGKEFELLSWLAARPNRVFTRDQLLDAVWGYEYAGGTRTVDVHVKRLRERFSGNEMWGIKTVWGVGYKFECI
ncbi:MAG: response regulator transcription factor [Clostridiales bacterium]|jgi:DNA-binding response OmpR family regulator|nr:response regulator transcription factor [Clostridiales bacterium]